MAAAATGGVLLEFGRESGALFRPFNAIAHLLLGPGTLITYQFDPVATPLGVALHVITVVVWGVIFSFVARSARGLSLVGIAVLFTGAVALFDLLLLPRRLHPGFDEVLSGPQLAFLYLVLALALAVALPVGERRAAGDVS
ncbi:MAG TPA: hypothetical protein VFK13_11850 [Gemmatimonadaceae bacterium]|nr:hypothetical protein [Gemmatimonadaceae bacterium]